jgi:hypothetical protein
VTEEDLLGLFRAVASHYVTPGMLSPGALAWIEHQIELAAARAAGDPRIPDPETATRFAERFFSELLPAAQTRLTPYRFGIVGNPAITPDALDRALAAFAFWPFSRG